jgi:hypothetical protein
MFNFIFVYSLWYPGPVGEVATALEVPGNFKAGDAVFFL